MDDIVAARRRLFIKDLAELIRLEAELYAVLCPKQAAKLNEPYRAAGDRLVDAALELIP